MSNQSVDGSSVLIKNIFPEYVGQYFKEWLFIRCINKEFKYFVKNTNEATRGLFQNPKVDKIKKFIKKFILAQERGRLQDTSNFEISSNDVDNLIKIKKNFDNFNQYIEFCKNCYDDDDQPFIDPYPGFKNIYDDFELFCSKFKIKFEDGDRFLDYYSESESDSDSESDDLVILYDSDSDSESDYLVILYDSDSDSD